MYDVHEDDDDLRDREELEMASSDADENARLAFADDGIEGDGAISFEPSESDSDE